MYRVAALEGVMHGVYLLWWVHHKHVPPALVAAILAAGDIALTILEVPTGWFADRCGHRVSLIAGSAVQIAGMLLCWLGSGVFGLLSASLMVALGDAFRSGADQALLYRSCAVLARSQDFQNIEAKTHAIELVALIGLILGGGAIVDAWGYAIGWLVEITLCSAGLMMACATIEPPADAGDAAEVVGRGASAVASSMPCRAGELKRLIKLIVPASLLGSTAAAALFLAQTAGERDPSSVTVLVASVTCAEAAGSALAGHLTAPARMQIPLAFLGAILAVTPIVWTAAFLPAVAGLSFLIGIAGPLRAAAVQSVVSDAVRARAASMASATDKALTSLALVCAGALAGRR